MFGFGSGFNEMDTLFVSYKLVLKSIPGRLRFDSIYQLIKIPIFIFSIYGGIFSNRDYYFDIISPRTAITAMARLKIINGDNATSVCPLSSELETFVSCVKFVFSCLVAITQVHFTVKSVNTGVNCLTFLTI